MYPTIMDRKNKLREKIKKKKKEKNNHQIFKSLGLILELLCPLEIETETKCFIKLRLFFIVENNFWSEF